LRAELAKGLFFVIVGHPQGQLVPKLLGNPLTQMDDLAVIHAVAPGEQAARLVEVLLGQFIHAHQQAAAGPLPPGKLINARVNLGPAPQVKVAHTKVGPKGCIQCAIKRWMKVLGDIVENSRQLGYLQGSQAWLP